jgi:hypothetical protein
MSICKTIKESLEARYSLDGLDEFITHTDISKPKSFYLNILDKDSKEEVAFIVLFVSARHLGLEMLDRISANPDYKGVARDIIKLAICKAVELEIPIFFHASPGVGKNKTYVSKNKTKLYKYYNNIGFTRINQEEGDDIYYHTTVEKLKEIMDSWNYADEGRATKRSKRGGGSTRKRKTRRK